MVKILNFRGDLSDISAKTATLVVLPHLIICQESCVQQGLNVSFNHCNANKHDLLPPVTIAEAWFKVR